MRLASILPDTLSNMHTMACSLLEKHCKRNVMVQQSDRGHTFCEKYVVVDGSVVMWVYV